MCRSPIPDHVITHPQVVSKSSHAQTSNSSSIFWCYESRRDQRTWWKYDSRTSDEIESSYQKYLSDINQTYHDQQIAGEIYEIDFAARRQYRKNGTGYQKRRIIIRNTELDRSKDVIVGTAGIKSIK